MRGKVTYGQLRRWAHMLGFGGHFLTKARRYSVTLTALRQARITYRRGHDDTGPEHQPLGKDDAEGETVLVLNRLSYVGTGWHTTGDALLANTAAVPARYAGRRPPVRLSATAVEVLHGPRVVARHERAAGKYAEILVLDHYLEVLRFKPGALPGATALAQARAAGAFTAAHQQYWDAARRK